MLNRVTRTRHVLVAASVLVVPVAVALGLIGGGRRPERFDAKQVVVTTVGDGVRLREVVDIDFGAERRHGYERTIPNDFGEPVGVTASSPDANADVQVDRILFDTRIRLGDPGTTYTGQHRYVLQYTLPEARLSTGELALDIIGQDETFETGRFDVVLAGFELKNPTCNVGTFGAVGGCTLTRAGDGTYRVSIAPLRPGDGITVGGTITGLVTPQKVADPALPARRADHRLLWAGLTLVFGAAVAVGGYAFFRSRGRNQVGGATAADAAFAGNEAPSRLVTDRELEDLATIEFSPPKGLRPWHGAILLREAVDDQTVSAWFSDQIAQGVLAVVGTDAHAVLTAGPTLAQAPPITKSRIEQLLGTDGTLALGTYSPALKDLWQQVREEQRTAADQSGWWRHRVPGQTGINNFVGVPVALAAMATPALLGSVVRQYTWFPFLAAALLVGLFAFGAYFQLLPSRTVTGSAAALASESFRRFLDASEGKHVEWAYQNGLLREYSAWAVSLGAAQAWSRAVAAAAVPPADLQFATMPLRMHTLASPMRSTFTPPRSSSGGGGGGFSSGFSGGGGGGGSSGSW